VKLGKELVGHSVPAIAIANVLSSAKVNVDVWWSLKQPDGRGTKLVITVRTVAFPNGVAAVQHVVSGAQKSSVPAAEKRVSDADAIGATTNAAPTIAKLTAISPIRLIAARW
jgi:hypothetical protein